MISVQSKDKQFFSYSKFFFLHRTYFLQKNYKILVSNFHLFQTFYMNIKWEEITIPHIQNLKKKKIKNLSHLKLLLLQKKIPYSLIVLFYIHQKWILKTSRLSYNVLNKQLKLYFNFANLNLPRNLVVYLQRFIDWFMVYQTKSLNIFKKNSFYKVRSYQRSSLKLLYNDSNSFEICPNNLKSSSKLNFRLFTKKKKFIKSSMSKKIKFKNSIRYWRNYNINTLNYPLLLKTTFNNTSSILLQFDINQRLYKFSSLRNIKDENQICYSKIFTKTKQNKINTLFKTKSIYTTSLKQNINENNNISFTSHPLSTFIIKNVGIKLLSKLNWTSQLPTNFKSQLKKKLYSFILPGQTKKNILLRRKKIILTRLLTKSTHLLNKVDKFSYQHFHQLFKVSIKTRLINHQYNSIKHISLFNDNQNYTYNLPQIYSTYYWNTKGFDVGDSYINTELKINRIRFKPGYQRLWRQVRAALKESLNIRFQYQKQLTKYLVKFYHLSNQYLFSYSESTLDKILLYSHLLPDLLTVKTFSNNGFIFLNGNVTTSINTIIIKNDFVQIIVSLWYYMITKWFLNWTKIRINKFKRMVYRKNKPLQYKVMKNKKQQSYYTPNWIHHTRYDNNDIKPYLEVDFFTLSIFVLNDLYLLNYHKTDDLIDLRNSTYMLYNWKYIT